MAKKKTIGQRAIADNRRARFDFEIVETFEAGIVLVGSEVKSLRTGKANIGDSYASNEGGEIFLLNSYIPEYRQAGRFNHEGKRARKLLLHAKEIRKLIGALQRDGLTLIPLKLYFNERGIAKVQVALARGKKLHDKRQVQKDRDWSRQKARVLRERG